MFSDFFFFFLPSKFELRASEFLCVKLSAQRRRLQPHWPVRWSLVVVVDGREETKVSSCQNTFLILFLGREHFECVGHWRHLQAVNLRNYYIHLKNYFFNETTVFVVYSLFELNVSLCEYNHVWKVSSVFTLMNALTNKALCNIWLPNLKPCATWCCSFFFIWFLFIIKSLQIHSESL